MPRTTTSRGGGWVVGQFIILAIILIVGYFDPWRTVTTTIHVGVGVTLIALSVGMLVMGFFHLGKNLTAFPMPLADGALVTHGMYALVRHPIYVAVILGAFGYSVYCGSWASAVGSIVLALWFDQKASREEAFLHEKFADYATYTKRVAKFIPGVY